MKDNYQHPKPQDVSTGGIARAPKELQPWKRDRPSERLPQRAVAIPRSVASRQGEAERSSPTSLSYHPSISFWYLPMTKPGQQPGASAAPRGSLLGRGLEQRKQTEFCMAGEEGHSGANSE